MQVFQPFLQREKTFFDFLFAFMDKGAISKQNTFLKERNVFSGSRFFLE